VYPLLPDDACWFLAADFDRADWRQDAAAFMQTCADLDVPAALEVSRSGAGAHAWIFFAETIPARDARRLGTTLISRTCSSTRLLGLDSYDRLFPNQDTLPRGGFGNLIALPLQKAPRAQGRSVFVDEELRPHPDQWAFLGALRRMSAAEVETGIQRASDGGAGHPLDVAFPGDEGEPWRRRPVSTERIPGPMPESVKVVLANRVFVEKASLPQPLANRLVRLAAFPNPEWHKAQALRLSVWNKPRVIGCAEDFPQHIALPRGCLEAALGLFAQHGIKAETQDERHTGSPVAAAFRGQLRPDQEAAAEAMLAAETGVLCAPTAFGKTVVAAALIARRPVSTLILVHRMELLKQWRERLSALLELPEGGLGVIGGGTRKPSGQVDIAVMQSLSRWEGLPELLDGYGQIIVDECHHLSAFSFEAILKQAKARYVVGLTATPARRDGHHPIIFMQCGPIRHTAGRPANAPALLEVRPCMLPAPEMPAEAGIQEVFRVLSAHAPRNERIAQDIVEAYREGRKVLVLTERTGHLRLLREAVGETIGEAVEQCFVLHGRMSRRQRAVVLAELEALDPAAPRVLMATGRLIGEGFDHPPLDTLVLAMPISWRGTLQQYAGRLHREHAGKRDVRIYDYVEQDHPQLARMWQKRVRGYRAMGYGVGMHEPGVMGRLRRYE
ncbi:MAG: DEAD/DEAH box helicase family protein, partial [Bacillota bacterium]|nr:DEAD/DEAH box helicase family protein [Bacillota bacterium]